MQKLKLIALPLLLSFSLVLAGCSVQQKALDVAAGIQTAVSIAQADVALLPAADQPIYTSFVNLLGTLDTQLSTCAQGATGLSAKTVAKNCFNTFATGLTSPTELAQLRLMSSPTQKRAILIVTAIIASVNIGLDFVGGAAITTPVLSAETTPSDDDVLSLERQIVTTGGNKICGVGYTPKVFQGDKPGLVIIECDATANGLT